MPSFNAESMLQVRDDIPGLGPGAPASLLLLAGPNFFGIIWNWFLLGTLVVQIYNYYLHYKRDSIWMKTLVYSVLIMDLAQTALTTHYSFHTFVLYFGNVNVFKKPAKTIIGLPLFGGLVGGTVQLFYAWRIWTLGRYAVNKIILTVLVTIISLLAILSTIGAVVGASLYLNIATHVGIYAHDVLTLYTIWISASFAVDTIIAVAMWVLLHNAKSNTAFRRTNDFVTKLIVRAIATGALNAVINGFEVLFLFHWPANDLSEIPSYLGGKLYSNAFISALNARVPDSDAYSVNVSGSTEVTSSQGRNTGGQLRSLTFAKPKTTGSNTFVDYDSKGASDIQLSSMGQKRDVGPYDYSIHA